MAEQPQSGIVDLSAEAQPAVALEHFHDVPSLPGLWRNWMLRDNPVLFETVKAVEPVFFSLLVVVVVGLVCRKATRRMTMAPGRLQNAVEMFIEGFYNFIAGVMGSREHARRHLPFIGSLFVFIWCNNMLGLVPGAKSPTSMFQTTFALGFCTFCYVQYHAIRMNGVWGWLYHLMGSPKGAVMWAMSPLMLVLEIMGEFIKPVSLSLRLFGNIMGEDILLYVFSFLGVSLILWGFPLQLPFFFLSLLLGTIQALVFTLLATIYVALFIPHEHAHGGHEGH